VFLLVLFVVGVGVVATARGPVAPPGGTELAVASGS
jgi:hypothetical protein